MLNQGLIPYGFEARARFGPSSIKCLLRGQNGMQGQIRGSHLSAMSHLSEQQTKINLQSTKISK